MIWDAVMTKMDVRKADRVDGRDWMVGDQSPRGLDLLGNLITERLDPSSRAGGECMRVGHLPCVCTE